MKDREFIELLNLYVDREISAADALRLESEVVANPKRREVYDQYCRMQKACTMLSEEEIGASAPAANIAHFPSSPSWSFGPAALGLAAAIACAVGIITFKLHEQRTAQAYAAVAANVSNAAKVAPATDADAMKPVFVVSRMPVDTAVATTRFDGAAKVDQLDWIGNVQMPPVFTASNQEFLTPKTDIKAAAIADAQAERDSQEPAEMTAFRFQR
ncbi:MAG TPA: hypothetical protein VFE25_15240 [Opitutaceae bacterium]|jgi:anti-sigma factor RsiW|nr:hypothetical protein [Opitutaceae bacterium]